MVSTAFLFGPTAHVIRPPDPCEAERSWRSVQRSKLVGRSPASLRCLLVVSLASSGIQSLACCMFELVQDFQDCSSGQNCNSWNVKSSRLRSSALPCMKCCHLNPKLKLSISWNSRTLWHASVHTPHDQRTIEDQTLSQDLPVLGLAVHCK